MNTQCKTQRILFTARYLGPLALFATALIAGCGGGGSGGSSSTTTLPTSDTGLLKPAGSEDALMTSLRTALQGNTRETATAPASADLEDSSGGTAASSFSTTYTLEEEVAEFDLVKYNGEHLFVARSIGFSSCWEACIEPAFVDDLAINSVLPPETEEFGIRILETDPAAATAAEVGNITIEDSEYVQGFYLNNDSLVTIGSQSYYHNFGSEWLDRGLWGNQTTVLRNFDISSPVSPASNWVAEIEGGFVDSRRIADTLYVVTRHTPHVNGLGFYPASEDDVEQNRQLLESATLDDLMPNIRINGEVSPLIASPENCLLGNEDATDEVDEDFSFPGSGIVTSITVIPVDDPNAQQTLCFNENSFGIYITSNGIYLTGYTETGHTLIHKLAIGQGLPTYEGSGVVEGNIWLGGQRDFRINEHNGQLRLVTTTFDQTQEQDRQDHHLYILEQDNDEPRLNVVGQLPNSARPQEIGKPNEALYGVRFFGERAYLVTFEQIDPLYVVDLSTPEDPMIAGELEIPGFSDFLHPVNDHLLLGLGREDSRVKLELFDIEDISQPVSRSRVLLGSEDSYSWSEALYNRHAFTYLAGAESTGNEGTDRLALPVSISGYDEVESTYYQTNALHLFEITSTDDADNASVNAVGEIDAEPAPSDNWYPDRHRSVIHDDAVYYISGEWVWSAFWDSPDSVTGPQ